MAAVRVDFYGNEFGHLMCTPPLSWRIVLNNHKWLPLLRQDKILQPIPQNFPRTAFISGLRKRCGRSANELTAQRL